jgi:hypothetical protein
VQTAPSRRVETYPMKYSGQMDARGKSENRPHIPTVLLPPCGAACTLVRVTRLAAVIRARCPASPGAAPLTRRPPCQPRLTVRARSVHTPRLSARTRHSLP